MKQHSPLLIPKQLAISNEFKQQSDIFNLYFINNLNKDSEIDEIKTLIFQNSGKQGKIDKLKEDSIKNMMYCNLKIPTSWINMVNYRENFYKIVQNDDKFFKFLSNYKSKSNSTNLPLIFKKSTLSSNSNTIYTNNTESKSSYLVKCDANVVKKDKSSNNILYNSSFISNSNLSKDILRNSSSIKILRNSKSYSNFKSQIISKKVSSVINLNSAEEFPQKKLDKLSNKNDQETKKEKYFDSTEYLNVQRFQKLKINNEKIRSLVENCQNLGPYYSKCNVCNNKNVSYFNKMGVDEAEKITELIKKANKLPDH